LLKGLPFGKTLSIPHKSDLSDSTSGRKLRIEKLQSTVTYPHNDDGEVVLVIGHIFEGHIAGTTITSFSTMLLQEMRRKKPQRNILPSKSGMLL
jgi:hypothetical protein